jgi:hypothetical protein
MTGRFPKFLALLMIFVFPVAVWCADTQGAILNVSPSAMVNGSSVSRSTAILAGDKLQVPAGGHGFLTMTGSSVLIAPGSSLIFEGKTVSLESDSGVGISTRNGVSVKAGSLTISPAQPQGKFEVARADGNVLVIAKLGSVSIFDGSSTTTVAEGTNATVADPDPQQGGATPAGTKVGFGKKKTWAIIAGLAAAGAATGIILATTGEPASPDHP